MVDDHPAEKRYAGLLARGRRDMRSDEAVRQLPERGMPGQGLDLEHVEARGAKRAVGQRAVEVGLALVPAACRVDHDRPIRQSVPPELAERLVIEDSMRLGRQRQQVYENIGARQERIELTGANEALDALDLLACAAPAAQFVAEHLE